jgi:hypothetical protein
MNPTNYLRFVKRFVPIHGEPHGPNGSVGRVVHILQQQWVSEDKFDVITGKDYVEWRDVPLEEE